MCSDYISHTTYTFYYNTDLPVAPVMCRYLQLNTLLQCISQHNNLTFVVQRYSNNKTVKNECGLLKTTTKTQGLGL